MVKKITIIIKCNNKHFTISCLKLSYLGKMLGLMFSKIEKSDILLFEFDSNVNKSIHSFYVFFDFLAVWLDQNNNIIETKIIKPWTVKVYCKKEYRKLIEIPIKKENQELVNNIIYN